MTSLILSFVVLGVTQASSSAEADRLRASLGLPINRLPAPATPDQLTREAARIRAFVQAVEKDRNGRSVSDPSGAPEPTPSSRANPWGWRSYDYHGFGLMVDPATGLIMSFGGRANHELDRPKRSSFDAQGHAAAIRAPREISDDEAKSIVARAYAATGRTYGVLALHLSDGQGGNGTNLAINFLPTYRGVPFTDEFAGYVEIDRETGELDDLMIRHEPPPPPENFAPAVSSDEAHWVALRAAATSGVAVEDFDQPSVMLSIGLLDQAPRRDSSYGFTPVDYHDAQMRRSRLVYDIRLNGADGKGGLYTVLIDAHDGHLLQVRRQVSAVFSGSDALRPKPFVLPANARAWRVAEGKEPWGKPVIDVLTKAPSDGFAPTRQLLMTDGHLALTASYDPKSELIGVENPDKTFATYRPGPALAELLRRKAKA